MHPLLLLLLLLLVRIFLINAHFLLTKERNSYKFVTTWRFSSDLSFWEHFGKKSLCKTILHIVLHISHPWNHPFYRPYSHTSIEPSVHSEQLFSKSISYLNKTDHSRGSGAGIGWGDTGSCRCDTGPVEPHLSRKWCWLRADGSDTITACSWKSHLFWWLFIAMN